MFGFGHALPSHTDAARELLGLHARANAGHEPRGLERRGGLHHRVKWIHTGHGQQFDVLAFLLGKFHYVAEELLLVLAKDLLLGKVELAGTSRDGADGHDDKVVASKVRLRERA